jgi:hypothetical protein
MEGVKELSKRSSAPTITTAMRKTTTVPYQEIQEIQDDVKQWYTQDLNFINQLGKSDTNDVNGKEDSSDTKQDTQESLKPDVQDHFPTSSNPIEDGGIITMRVKEIPTQYNIPFNSKESLIAALSVLNLVASKFGIVIKTEEKKDDDNSDSDNSSKADQDNTDPEDKEKEESEDEIQKEDDFKNRITLS